MTELNEFRQRFAASDAAREKAIARAEEVRATSPLVEVRTAQLQARPFQGRGQNELEKQNEYIPPSDAPSKPLPGYSWVWDVPDDDSTEPNVKVSTSATVPRTYPLSTVRIDWGDGTYDIHDASTFPYYDDLFYHTYPSLGTWNLLETVTDSHGGVATIGAPLTIPHHPFDEGTFVPPITGP